MKFDKLAIRESEQDTNINTENTIIETHDFEKDDYRNKSELCEQDIEKIENAALQLKCLNLDSNVVFEKKFNHDIKMTKSLSNSDVETNKNNKAMEIIDEELAINSNSKPYNKILTLDLSGEMINSIEESMSQMLTNLVVLNLSHSNLSTLPDFLDFKNLKQLNISHNKFESLPVCLQVFNSKIVNLDISHNSLKNLDKLRCIHTLRKLDINNNPDMKIPEWFWYEEFYFLEELDMSFTHPFFQQLPVWLLNHIEQKERGVFTKLVSLNLQNTCAYMNKVAQLKSLKCIKYLNLSNVGSVNVNILWELPHCIPHLTSVQELHLSSIQLNFIPEEISNLCCLEILNLSRNRIVRLPESLPTLRSLKVLDISYNNLVMLPEEFGKLSNLTTLHAQSNCIPEVPVGFEEINLVYCDFYNNELGEKCVPLINKMISLQSLDLMQNYIKQDLLPLHLLENLRASLAHPEDRSSETKKEYIQEDDDYESTKGIPQHHQMKYEDSWSGNSSLDSSSTRCSSPEPSPSTETPLPDQSVVVCSNADLEDSDWDDEATNSDKFNFCIVGDEWQNHLPKTYDEAIEMFRTRQPSDTTFIPGDSQVKYFKRKDFRRFDFLSRPVVPGQFDDA